MAGESGPEPSRRFTAPDGDAPALIRTGSLELRVTDARTAATGADSIARAHGGYVTNLENAVDERGRHWANLTIRVPADAFDPTLSACGTLGDVRRQSTAAQDVTRQLRDLATRLTVAEATQERLRRLLAERTGKLADVLEAERELSRVVTEIERLKGERQLTERQVSYATITVALREAPLETLAGPAPLRDAVRQSLRVLSLSVAWLVYLVTFVAPWAALASLGWWVVRSAKRRLGATAPESTG